MYDAIVQQIQDDVRRLVQHEAFTVWMNEKQPQAEDVVLVNNSFVYRGLSATKKSSKYIALTVSEDGGIVNLLQIAELYTKRINSDFKKVSRRSQNLHLVSLPEAIEEEIKNLGTLVFALIGELDDGIIAEEEINLSGFQSVQWNPSINKPVKIDNQTIIVKNAYDVDGIWKGIETIYHQQGTEIPDKLQQALGATLEKLQSNAVAHLHVPTSNHIPEEGLFDIASESLRQRCQEYVSAYDEWKNSGFQATMAFNDMLRVAYVFSHEAITLLKLIVSVCDLKPIVLWGTIAEHLTLSEAFRALKWTRLKRKPLLEDYQRTIDDARNSSFHNMFPFHRTIEVILPDGAIREARLRIFSEYHNRAQNRLLFQDQELADVLLSFTRSRQRYVPARFWEQNKTVMQATVQLFERTAEFLRALLAVS